MMTHFAQIMPHRQVVFQKKITQSAQVNGFGCRMANCTTDRTDGTDKKRSETFSLSVPSV
jgi:hypothetical protein